MQRVGVTETDPPQTSSEELPQASRTIAVSTASQLQTAVNNALPGDHIVLADGVYSVRLTVDKQGTVDRPIVIRAKNILGAHLSSGFDFSASSRHIWLYGIDLKDATSNLRGENHVIRRVRIWPPFKATGGSFGITPTYGKNSRIDYCELRLYTTNEVKQLYGTVWQYDTSYGGVKAYYRDFGTEPNNWFENLTIERCLLTGGPSGVDYHAPNSQFIEADGSQNTKRVHDINWNIRDIYGDVPRDRTLIDLKYRGMTLERVHIKSPSGGTIQVRDGNYHSIKDSRFEGGTISVNGEYTIIENTIASAIKLIAGTIPWDSNTDLQSADHRQVYKARLSHTSGPLSLGYAYDASNTYPVLQTTIESHSGTINRLNEQGTIISQTSSVVKEEWFCGIYW
jgi:hypothetical protein